AHRYWGFDDAIYSAARLCELLSRSNITMTEHVDSLPHLHNTPEIRYELSDEIKFEVVKRAVARFQAAKDQGITEVVDVDGARVLWKDGWALVRASNTQPALVLRFEAESAARLGELRSF